MMQKTISIAIQLPWFDALDEEENLEIVGGKLVAARAPSIVGTLNTSCQATALKRSARHY